MVFSIKMNLSIVCISLKRGENSLFFFKPYFQTRGKVCFSTVVSPRAVIFGLRGTSHGSALQEKGYKTVIRITKWKYTVPSWFNISHMKKQISLCLAKWTNCLILFCSSSGHTVLWNAFLWNELKMQQPVMQSSSFTFKALRHVKSSIPALGPHHITAVSGLIHAVNWDHFIV